MRQLQAEIRALNEEAAERETVMHERNRDTGTGTDTLTDADQAVVTQLRDQIHSLQEQIVTLRQSDLAMGLSDELPPVYSRR